MVLDVGLILTFVKGSIDRCHTPIPNLFNCTYLELKQVTWAMIGRNEVELWLIHTAVGDEWNPFPADVVDLHTVPEVRIHSSDIQGEGRGPGNEDE